MKKQERNGWDEGYDIPEEEAGKFEVNFSGKVKIEAFDGGDAIRDVTENLRDAGFLVESVSAYKQ
jgi:hypothetical protein